MIQIMTDSTTDLDSSLIGDYNLVMLPLTIAVDNKSYLDKQEIQAEQVYDMMRQEILPKTSQIPIEIVYQSLLKAAEKGDDIIYISFSAQMSSCFSLVNTVADQVRLEFPNVKIALIDSQGGCCATGLIVWQAVKMAVKGVPFETLVANVQDMVDKVVHIFTVADLKWMVLGGRIPKPVGYLGSKLSIQPWLTVEEGKMVVKGMVHGRKKSIDKLIEETIKQIKHFKNQLIAVAYAADRDTAEQVSTRLKELIPECATFVMEIGAVLSVHLGLNGIGIFFFGEEPAGYLHD